MKLFARNVALWGIFTMMLSFVYSDHFNYGFTTTRENGVTSHGQRDWDKVQCNNRNTCTGFPNKYPSFPGFNNLRRNGNNCRWCPADRSVRCGLHRQSPIDLQRDRAVPGHPNWKECPDWHWMPYLDDTCTWDDMKSQFTIERHALQIHTPQLPNGDINCVDGNNRRRYPRLDYSKGFPDWWWLQRTDVHVPSNHIQEGTRYAAEVVLAHFYEINHVKNQLGYVSVFMQDYPGARSWAYLDKLICQWRKEEDKVRAACGLPPVTPYGRCALLRGQAPTQEWLDEAAGIFQEDEVEETPVTTPASPPTELPVSTPVDVPVPSPVVDLTEPPVETIVVEDPVTFSPVSIPSDAPVSNQPIGDFVGSEIPPPIDCSQQPASIISRMCDSLDPCCEATRSDTRFCWDAYDNIFPGEQIKSACYHCCSQPKIVGEPNPPKPGLVLNMKCSDVSNPLRICREGSCCSNPRSNSAFCQGVYATYGGNMEAICHHCCRIPRPLGAPRRLRTVVDNNTMDFGNQTTTQYQEQTLETHHEVNKQQPEYDENYVPEGAKVYYSGGNKYVIRKESFEPFEEDHNQYFQNLYSRSKGRSLQTEVHEEDYANIPWFPYEWLIEVGTEYYYRYEGTQIVPPCWEDVHWRVLMQPIVVHERQIKELNRLLAWRRNPRTCQVETAGVLSPDGDRVSLSREVNYYESPHRMVFCECKNWPSKFEADQEWCRNWREDVNHDRFFKRPYNFESNWLP